jgi:hypothetical protein
MTCATLLRSDAADIFVLDGKTCVAVAMRQREAGIWPGRATLRKTA